MPRPGTNFVFVSLTLRSHNLTAAETDQAFGVVLRDVWFIIRLQACGVASPTELGADILSTPSVSEFCCEKACGFTPLHLQYTHTHTDALTQPCPGMFLGGVVLSDRNHTTMTWKKKHHKQATDISTSNSIFFFFYLSSDIVMLWFVLNNL